MIIEHCRAHAKNWGDEEQAIRAMRARFMAYSKNFPGAKVLREKFQHVSRISEIEHIARAAFGWERLLPSCRQRPTAKLRCFEKQAGNTTLICERRNTSS